VSPPCGGGAPGSSQVARVLHVPSREGHQAQRQGDRDVLSLRRERIGIPSLAPMLSKVHLGTGDPCRSHATASRCRSRPCLLRSLSKSLSSSSSCLLRKLSRRDNSEIPLPTANDVAHGYTWCALDVTVAVALVNASPARTPRDASPCQPHRPHASALYTLLAPKATDGISI